MASTALSTSPKAVITSTGTLGSFRLTPRRTSSPSTFFMRRSVTTTSAGSEAKRSSAAVPLPAISVSNPAASSSLATVCATSMTSSTTRARILRMELLVRRLRRHGPPHRNLRTLFQRARNMNFAAVVADDAGHDGEAQPRPLAALLGGEEGVEHRVEVLGRDAAPLILHVDLEKSTFWTSLAARRDRHPAALARGVAGVEQQVDQHLLELVRVGRHVRERGVEARDELEVAGVELPLQEGPGALDDGPQRHRAPLDRLPPREVEHPADRRGDVVDVLDDGAQVVGARAAVEHAQHLLGPPADDGQRAADLVRDPGRQHADGDQLLGPDQLVLERAQLGLVLDEGEGPHARLVALDRDDPDLELVRPGGDEA